MTSTTPTPAVGLSPEAARRIAHTATVVVILVGLTAGILSWEGLHRLALDAGINPRLAWGVPLVIDGTVVAGLLGTLAGTLSGTGIRYPLALVMLGASASVAGNIAAAPATTVGRTVAVAAPLCLAATLEQGLRVLRHRAGLPAPRTRRQQRTTAPATAVAGTPVAAAAAPVRRPRTPAVTTTATTAASARPSARREQVAALLAEQPDITGSAVARALAIDPADGRRHLRALRAEQPAPLALVAAAAGGA